jgi:uncharacterized membrane protein YkvA (DUF1232 family)
MAKFTVVHTNQAPKEGPTGGNRQTGAPARSSADDPNNLEAVNENAEMARQAEQAESEVSEPEGWFARSVERVARKLGHAHLVKLAVKRGHVSKSLEDVPKRMHRVANQTRLVLELIDDFVDGRYRQIPWRSIVVLAGAVLYTVSPGDVVPDFVPVLGALDDLAVLAVATRLLRKDLERYCRFKHYSVPAYFG